MCVRESVSVCVCVCESVCECERVCEGVSRVAAYLGHDLFVHLQLRLRPVHGQLVTPQVHVTIHQLASCPGCCTVAVILHKRKPNERERQ